MHCFGYTLVTSTICAELDPGIHMRCIRLPFLNRVRQCIRTCRVFVEKEIFTIETFFMIVRRALDGMHLTKNVYESTLRILMVHKGKR
jgi:hypothetical protein